jgi:hypothetical protein
VPVPPKKNSSALHITGVAEMGIVAVGQLQRHMVGSITIHRNHSSAFYIMSKTTLEKTKDE